MNYDDISHRTILEQIAEQAMRDRGLLPDFSSEALEQLSQIQAPADAQDGDAQDLRHLLWSSIDNDDSMDLDQLSVAEELPQDRIKVWVAIANVSALVHSGTPIDQHARHNTTTVYTAARIFPMLPEKLSTDLTSLSPDADRLALVVEMIVAPDGALHGTDISLARVHNYAKLAYNRLASWLEGQSEPPEAVSAVAGLAQNLKLQDRAAARLKRYRHQHGALSLETIEAHPVFDGQQVRELQPERKNRAKDLIEDLMIAANEVTARFLSAHRLPSIRRVVRAPKRWERIVEVADEHGASLPAEPDSRALEEFLTRQKARDPLRFPDLSLSIIKLLGAGEYVAEAPGEDAPGHFGLAVKDYTHSTAPNRRYTDLITQRLLIAALEGRAAPYSVEELSELARHCTLEEDAANKVERQVGKSAAALLLQERIGEHFDALVTGAAAKGTWVRLLETPVEGKLVEGYQGVDVGHRIRVELVDVNVERGYIDFKKIKNRR